MKENTSCGGHKECPSNELSHTVKSHSGQSRVEPFTTSGDVEERIVLADLVLQTQVEADIKLPTPASAIKQIKKNVKITQCKAIRDNLDPTGLFVKLFVEGFVHKNIQFSEGGHGCLQDFSVNVPFRIFQRVPVEIPALFPFGEFSIKDSILERRELSKDGHGADECQTGSLHFEVFTEPIQCKLLFAIVDEWDLFDEHDNWGRFEKITEKMDIILGLKLFQQQQQPTPVPTPTGGFPTRPAITDFFRNLVSRGF